MDFDLDGFLLKMDYDLDGLCWGAPPADLGKGKTGKRSHFGSNHAVCRAAPHICHYMMIYDDL